MPLNPFLGALRNRSHGDPEPIRLMTSPRTLMSNALAVLLSKLPLAFVDTTVGPSEDARPMLLVSHIFTLVRASVLPGRFSLPVHPILSPLSMVLPAISPAIHTVAMHPIVLEVTLVGGSVGEIEVALTVFATELIVTREAIAMWPNF
eukprot:CAMPEP_0170596738 /NCGR_PEP_ID=MMETSP0224-20130122/15300_1 /TAXON_ID=285029 /ORGANISM="Togula jolla, Strain CCCM 725" /LENGTH=147 /DNA_ID=CAMNT_0010921095 /DNA_START=33 /DNA_END=477 /DNA_ORIENTATION=+